MQSGIPVFFTTPKKLRSWFEKNHSKLPELWLGFYKKDSGKPSVTYQEALDEALAFGWIDGIRKSLGEESYVIRFTPRKKNSIWSQVNIRRIAELTKLGRMHESGKTVFETRNPEKANRYSFEQEELKFSSAEEKKFRANKSAWKFFNDSPPSYRKPATWWVLSAKKEETRTRRLQQLIEDSANGRRIKSLIPAARQKK
jgi:uncharacterized protein YdeI (YjbR/CyaY-like superfamily)